MLHRTHHEFAFHLLTDRPHKGFKVGWYGMVPYTGTSLATLKAYWHFFFEKKPTGMLSGSFLRFRQLVGSLMLALISGQT